MTIRWVRAVLTAALVIAVPTALSATPRPKAQPQLDPVLDEEDQIAPSQVLKELPAKPARPAVPPAVPFNAAVPAQPKAGPTPQGKAANLGPAPHSVACSGPIGKDSSHAKLAVSFGSQNVVYSEVNGPGGSKIRASVIFPKDPKRRLEVVWENDEARTGTSVIDINGQSTWAAPKGLHLGLPLTAVEKLNGQPFKLHGFDQDGEAPATDWMGGAILEVPGGCRIGVHFRPNPKASAEARAAVAVDKELSSNDPAIVAVKPIVSEILLGF